MPLNTSLFMHHFQTWTFGRSLIDHDILQEQVQSGVHNIFHAMYNFLLITHRLKKIIILSIVLQNKVDYQRQLYGNYKITNV